MLIELIKEALTTLKTNVLRTVLTMIGIILGVGAVVTIMTSGKSTYATVEKEVYDSGLGNVNITHNSGGAGGRQVVPLDDSLVSILKASGIEEIVDYEYGMDSQMATAINNEGDSINATIFYRWAQRLTGFHYLAGGPFVQDDVELRSQVAVVNQILAEKLFGTAKEAMGQMFTTDNGFSYQIVGVVEGQGANGVKDGVMFVPMSLGELLPSFQSYGYDVIMVKLKIGSDYDKVSEAIKKYLMEVFGFAEEEEMTFAVGTVSEMMKEVSTMLNVFSGGLSLVAAISLLVGGVGIMNIMLVSVTERTKEIGLMKALGARDGNIVFQFLVESVVMTVCGGLLGVVGGLGAGVLIVKLVNTFGGSDLPEFVFAIDYWSMVLSMVVSIAIGLIFGAYPASRAAKLRPVEALRRD